MFSTDDRSHFHALAQRFSLPEVSAIVLMGSYARGDAGPFSDVDLVRFTVAEITDLPGNGSHLIADRLVVVSDVTPAEVEKGFTQPEMAVRMIQGWRNGRSLIDKHNTFSALQQRAHAFQWDDTMQAKANAWASAQMVGWIEEVHKGLEGLRRHDPGRLINAQFGCSWGLARVICVQRGVLLSGDNALVAEVTAVLGEDSTWSGLCRQAFGLDGATTLADRVVAGLRLYVETAVLLQPILRPQDAPLIQAVVNRLNSDLPLTDTH
ncbi:MAG: nucleotidyltransferase domain-containing protein [Chloroflexota bacterium]